MRCQPARGVGGNDAPVVVADVAAVTEDSVVTKTGNVLTNDSDLDAGTVLAVAAPGTFVGTYGSLVLAADGSYTYTLNNSSAQVQSLQQGQTVQDLFTYGATDDFGMHATEGFAQCFGGQNAHRRCFHSAAYLAKEPIRPPGNTRIGWLWVDLEVVVAGFTSS